MTDTLSSVFNSGAKSTPTVAGQAPTPFAPDEADIADASTVESPDDLLWVGAVRRMFQAARDHRRPRVAQWMRSYAVLQPRRFQSGRPSYIPNPDVPEIYPILASHVGWMTDQRVVPRVATTAQPNSPYSSYLSDLAEDLERVLLATFTQESYDAEIETSCYDAHIYGVGILKTSWDPLAVGGMGDAVVKRIDPFTFYLDPKATSLDDAAFMIEARSMSISMLRRRFGDDVAESIAPSAYTEDLDRSPNINQPAPGSYPMADPGRITTGTPSYGLPGQTSRARATDDPGVTILEAWIREQETFDMPNGDTARFDSWRCVVICGNKVLMNVKAMDMWLHIDHPYSSFNLMRNGEFYGLSTVELLEGMQISINRILGAIERNIDLVGNPVYKETTRSGNVRNTMRNEPGQRIQVSDINDGVWLNPPQMQPQMAFQVIDWYTKRMEVISGLAAQNRGQIPKGRNSTEVLDDVSEGSFVRIRMGLRNLERALRRSLTLAAALITEFYDAPRLKTVIGPDGDAASLALTARHFYVPNYESGQPATPMRFMLNVQAGSSLPTSRIAVAQEADVLFAMGALDVQGVLDAHQWPGRSEILKRIQAQMAAGTFQPPGARQRAQH